MLYIPSFHQTPVHRVQSKLKVHTSCHLGLFISLKFISPFLFVSSGGGGALHVISFAPWLSCFVFAFASSREGVMTHTEAEEDAVFLASLTLSNLPALSLLSDWLEIEQDVET